VYRHVVGSLSTLERSH
jgi:hypothetical protein